MNLSQSVFEGPVARQVCWRVSPLASQWQPPLPWFQSTPAPESLSQDILDYLQDQGDYEAFSEWAEGEWSAAKKNRSLFILEFT